MSKVLHISTVHRPQDTRIFHKECRSLSDSGRDVYLMVTGAAETAVDGVKLMGLKPRKSRFMRMIFGVKEARQKAVKLNPTIVHLHDPELIPLGLTLKKKGIKVIYDLHELTAYQMADKVWLGPFRKVLAGIYRNYEKKAVRRFDAIVLAEDSYGDYMNENYPGFADRFHFVRNYPDLEKLDAISPGNFEEDSGEVIYAGGLTEIRGVKEMIAAMDKLEARLCLAGPWRTEELRLTCKKILGWSQVDYVGYLDFEEVIKRNKSARVGLALLHPVKNYENSAPVKVFEYLACGIPVVASNFALWQSMFPEGVVFCDPLDVESIYQAIYKLLIDPVAAREMGRKGRELVENQYQWKSEGAELVNLYERLGC